MDNAISGDTSIGVLNMTEFLRALSRTLNNIEVKGKDNLDMLLGSIMAIEDMIAKIEKSENKQEVDDG